MLGTAGIWNRKIQAPWTEVACSTPCAALVTSLAMMCPFEPREKQALLEAGTLAERAKVLTTLLELSSLVGEGGPGVMH